MNEDYDRYTGDANKQSDFEAMKKNTMKERRRAAKDNADKLENEIKNINSKIAYLKKTTKWLIMPIRSSDHKFR